MVILRLIYKTLGLIFRLAARLVKARKFSGGDGCGSALAWENQLKRGNYLRITHVPKYMWGTCKDVSNKIVAKNHKKRGE